MNMFEELKAWAEKWNIPHKVVEGDCCDEIYFDSCTYCDPLLSYNKETGDYCWYGGD